MPVRTTETTVTFARPFVLASFDAPKPAGTYRIIIEEEAIEGLSFPAYRHLSTTLETPAISVLASVRESFPVDGADLKAALAADAQGSPRPSTETG